MIYGAGMRVSEVSNISLDDILLEQNCIVVHGKGQKDRLAPFNPRSRAAFDAYLPARRRLARKYKLKTRALMYRKIKKMFGEGDTARSAHPNFVWIVYQREKTEDKV